MKQISDNIIEKYIHRFFNQSASLYYSEYYTHNPPPSYIKSEVARTVLEEAGFIDFCKKHNVPLTTRNNYTITDYTWWLLIIPYLYKVINYDSLKLMGIISKLHISSSIYLLGYTLQNTVVQNIPRVIKLHINFDLYNQIMQHYPQDKYKELQRALVIFGFLGIKASTTANIWMLKHLTNINCLSVIDKTVQLEMKNFCIDVILEDAIETIEIPTIAIVLNNLCNFYGNIYRRDDLKNALKSIFRKRKFVREQIIIFTALKKLLQLSDDEIKIYDKTMAKKVLYSL